MNKQQAIDNIMDNFNFHKAWKMMQCNKGFWIHTEECNSESTLRRWCREKLQNLYVGSPSFEIGGFIFKYEVEDDSHYIGLQFVGESWDNY